MTPAETIASALHAAGVSTQRAQAALLGEHPQHWNRYLVTSRAPSVAKVQQWLAKCAEAGHPITLTLTSKGAS